MTLDRYNDVSVGVRKDDGKPEFSLIDPDFLLELAELLTRGAGKYSRDNWKDVPCGRERAMNSLMRHLNAFRRGEECDKETGASHIIAVACNAMFIHWYDKDWKGGSPE